MKHLWLTSLLLLTACTTTQLKSNTLNISSVLQSIMSEEVLDNLGAFSEDNYQLASEGIVSAGTAQVTNTVNPSVTFPLTSMLANTFVGTPSQTKTNAAATSTLSATATWQLNFNIVPIIDTTTLRNLSILYRTVLDVRNIKSDLFVNYQPPQTYRSDNRLVPDPYYLAYSNCVFCVDFDETDTLKGISENNIVTNKSLKDWLKYHYNNGQPPMPIGDAPYLVTINDALAFQ